MKLSEFILLDVAEKKLTVLHEGILLAKRSNQECLVFLFQLDHYYVETYCNRENRSIEEFRVFDHVQPLSPYLDAIPIDHLLS